MTSSAGASEFTLPGPPPSGVAHGSQVDDRRHAGKILQDHM
jgi:hypothetical protein